MSLPNLSVKRPTAVSMFFIGIALIGGITFRLLPVEMMPNTSFGDITINIDVRGGIPASEIEKRIAKPVEEAVGTVTHLKNILSISKEGNATIILEFEPGTNMEFAALEVREKFNRIRNKLPSEIEKPVIAKYEYMDVPIMILAVTSSRRTPEELRKVVDEKIKDRIQRIEGVARAEVSGGRERKILIEVDQTRLQAYALSINRLVDIINLNNTNLLAGEIKRIKDKYLVRTIGEFQSLDELKDIAIATTKQGSVIRLKDVASIYDSYLEPTAFARVNTQPVVSIYIQKESIANTVQISGDIEREIENLKHILDKEIKITSTFNQAEAIKQAVNQVKLSLLYGAVLATLILLLFLRDLRSVFIISLTIPLSVLFAFSLMLFSKLSLNVMTLSGLALGVGMLVDNSIVVLDNIFKKREEFLLQPESNARLEKECAISGADEMLLAISASTLTTIIVFLPLVFINPEIRMLYSSIALTITYSLLASLLVALTLVPMLFARLRLERPKALYPHTQESSLSLRAPEGRSNPVFGFASSLRSSQLASLPRNDGYRAPFSEWCVGVYEKMLQFYKSSLGHCLNFRYLVILLSLIAFLRILQESQKLEKEFIGIAEQNKFTIFIEMPTGTRLDVSDKIVSQVEKLASELPEIKTVTSKVEPWSSKVYAELLPLNKRKLSTEEVIGKLRPFTDQIKPAFIYYEEPEEIGTKEILLELYGYDYEVLKNLAIQVAQKIQPIPKFTDVKIRMREGRPEMRVVVDKRQAALFGLSVQDISLGLHTQMRGLVATRYHGTDEPLVRLKRETSIQAKEAKEVETIVRLEERFRRAFADLRRLNMVNSKGEQAYLSQLAEFRFDLGPSEIWRKNKSRMVQVSANTGGMALGTASQEVKQALLDLKLPKDCFWQFGGNYERMMQNQRELSFALILSLALVYMILAGLLESFKQPFIILFSVPLASIGAIIALRITGKPVGTGVLIGAIMLGGIVVNNAIVLIDRINFLRQKTPGLYTAGLGIRQVIITAAGDRLRPILMTSLTTILGLIPMALDKSESANLWSPLAITVIGGLTVSTFLTLFIIPAVYLVFEDLRLRPFLKDA